MTNDCNKLKEWKVSTFKYEFLTYTICIDIEGVYGISAQIRMIQQ